MSYSESNGQVILTMSKEDYYWVMWALHQMDDSEFPFFALIDRLNFGNPHYTPYQVETKK